MGKLLILLLELRGQHSDQVAIGGSLVVKGSRVEHGTGVVEVTGCSLLTDLRDKLKLLLRNLFLNVVLGPGSRAHLLVEERCGLCRRGIYNLSWR